MRIVTNNQIRPVLCWSDLTSAEQRDFAYRDDDDGAVFARYRGATYDLSDFPRAPVDLEPWHGALPDTAFSAVLCRFPDDGDNDSVIMGRCYS